jgi:hypothetical protein
MESEPTFPKTTRTSGLAAGKGVVPLLPLRHEDPSGQTHVDGRAQVETGTTVRRTQAVVAALGVIYAFSYKIAGSPFPCREKGIGTWLVGWFVEEVASP